MVNMFLLHKENNMQPWQPGKTILTDFDIKLGKLHCAVRKSTLTETHILKACQEADHIVLTIIQGVANGKQIPDG